MTTKGETSGRVRRSDREAEQPEQGATGEDGAGPEGGGTASDGDGAASPAVRQSSTGHEGEGAGASVEPGDGSDIVLSNWVFIDEKPTVERTIELLGTLNPVWGVRTAAFADYVQPLMVRGKDEPGYRGVKEWRLYMSVAGREMMLQAAQEINEWEVHSTGEYIEVGEKVIYKVTIAIYNLGSRAGVAALHGGTHPYEKAETGANGRAIASWGFGVLPGSGVASLDEMTAGPQPAQERQSKSQEPKETAEKMLEDVLGLAEEARQLRGFSEHERDEKLANYIKSISGIEIVTEQDEDGKITKLDWKDVKPAQLQMARNQGRKTLAQLRAQEDRV